MERPTRLAELDPRQRIESQFVQRPPRIGQIRVVHGQHPGGLLADVGQGQFEPFGGRNALQFFQQHADGPLAGRRPPARASRAMSASQAGSLPGGMRSKNFGQSIGSTPAWVRSSAMSCSRVCRPRAGSIQPTPAADQRRPSASLQPRRHAHLGPGAPVDAQRRPLLPAAMMGQGVEEGVGGGVVALARRAQQRGGRREQHEQIQRLVAGQLVQVPGAEHFGRHDPVEPLAGLLAENAVVQHAGQVEDAAQRRQFRADVRQQAGDLARDCPRRSGGPRRGRRPFRALRVAIAASADAPDLPTRTRCRAPRSASQRATFRPRPPRPPVTRYVPSSRSENARLAEVAVRGGLDHHFADVLGPRHVPQRVDRALDAKRPQRQRLEFPLDELRHHFAHQLADALRLFGHHAIQGDRDRTSRPA